MTTRKQHCLIHSFTLCSLKAPSHSLLLILPVPALNMGDIHETEEEVYKALSALDPTKSSGIDGLGSKLLKHCALALYALICHLFNLTITKRYLPSEWKLHLITPIHKSGDRAQVNNYRPISLLCTVSKFWNVLYSIN